MSLTLRGRARRLRGLAKAALVEYDLDVRRMRLIMNSWNCVFRIDTPDGPYVIRVSLPGYGHSLQRVRSEAAYLAALTSQTDLRAPRPIPSRDGRLAVAAGAAGVPEERMCVVYSWVPGSDLAESVTPTNYAMHGALHARLHGFGALWQPPAGFDVHEFDRVFHMDDDVVVWDAELFGYTDELRQAWGAANELIQAVRTRDPVIITHGDLHQFNVKLHRGVLAPIDFEDLMYATRGLDVAISLYYVSRRDDYAALRDAFRRGYETVAPWPEGVPGEIDALRFNRALLLLNLLAGDAQFRVADWRATVERVVTLGRGLLSHPGAGNAVTSLG